jgi:uncharacterized protein involved in exopolysaccharide biosynthesis
MSFLNHNPNSLPHASPGPAPVLEGVASPRPPRPFSQPFIPQAGGPSEPPNFDFQIGRSLRMHPALAVLVGLAVCLLLVALGLTQPQTYTAASVIYVEPMVARNLNEQGVPGFDQFRYGSFLDQQMQTIVRPDVLTAALRSLPEGTWRGPLESEQSAVARLSKALKVERASTSYQITVQLKASDPDAAAAIVNAVTKAYLQRGREDEFKQADLREQILSEERDRVKAELETDRKEQAALGASMGLASPADGAGNPYDSDLAGLRAQLATAREARDIAAAQLESVSGQDAGHRSGLTASAEDQINSDPGLSAKKAAVNARRVVLESMMAGMTPNNPQYRQAQDEIADLDRSLEAKTEQVRAQTERRIQDKLRTELQRTADVESKINGQLAQATAKATGAGPKLQRAAELATDIQRLTARYTTVDEALNALELETSGPGMAHVPLPAAVPLSPDSNHRDLFFLAALPLGLVCGVSAAVLARMRDHRVYLGSDLQKAIGFAPLAVLPARRDVSTRVLDEYVLRLAAGVESAYRTAGAQSFVVTAVSADTGTALLLSDLASKLEDLRLRVLVVKSSELLVPSQETLEHQAATAALIAAGVAPPPVQAGEGIASAKLDRLKGEYDIILIDAAPLLHSAETEYAARCADATLLVAESAITQTTELAAATGLLSRLRVTGVGAVLDQLKLDQADREFRRAARLIRQRNLESVPDGRAAVQREPEPEKDPVKPSAAPNPPRKPVAAPAAAVRATTLEAIQPEPKPVNSIQPAVDPARRPRKPVGPVPVRPPAPAIVSPASTPAPAPVEPEPGKLGPTIIAPARPAVAASAGTPTPAAATPIPGPPRPQSPAAPPRPAPALVPAKIPAAAASAKPVVPAVAATANPAPAQTTASEPMVASPPVQPSPEVAQPAAVAAFESQPANVVLPADAPRRSFKHWTVEPAISSEETERVIARPGIGKRFELLDDVAAAATGTNGNSPHSVPAARPEIASSAPAEQHRAALHAASAKMRLTPRLATAESSAPFAEPEHGGDPDAVGRFVGEKDKIGAVPPYTRSNIRLAFKEQEVNSKTTWFSKLFRGDPPTPFRVVPESIQQDEEAIPTPRAKLHWDPPSGQSPAAKDDGDPELSTLVRRMNPSAETKIAWRARPVPAAPPSESAPAFGSPLPFAERRSTPRPIEIDEYRATPAAPADAVPEAPVWDLAVPAPLTSPLASARLSPAPPAPTPPAPPAPAAAEPVPPVPVRPVPAPSVASAPAPAQAAAPPSPEPAPPAAVPSLAPAAPASPQPASDARPSARPLRPLTFHQLAGKMAAEAQFEPAHEAVQPAESTFSAPEPPVVLPFSFAEPPRPTTPFVVPVPATQSYSEAFATTAPPIPAPVVASVSHTGTSIWPASEPMLSSYAPPFRAAELPPAPEPEVYPASAALPAVADAVAAPEVATPAAPSPLPEQPAAEVRSSAFPSSPILSPIPRPPNGHTASKPRARHRSNPRVLHRRRNPRSPRSRSRRSQRPVRSPSRPFRPAPHSRPTAARACRLSDGARPIVPRPMAKRISLG